MKRDDPPLRHSQRPRAPAFWAIIELGHDSRDWLASARIRGKGSGRIEATILRALTALNRAAEGRDAGELLARSRRALSDCEQAFLLLAHQLPAGVIRSAVRRIDQILRSLDELEAADVSRWPVIALPLERSIAVRPVLRLVP